VRKSQCNLSLQPQQAPHKENHYPFSFFLDLQSSVNSL
jgi:hypothetical protein